MSDLSTVPATIVLLEELLAKMKGEQPHSAPTSTAAEPPDDDERSLTIGEFCDVENFSRSKYFDMRLRGLGPDETRMPGSNLVRITQADRAIWHERMKTLAQSEAAETERQRRSVRARIAGKKAAASPRHVRHRGARSKTQTRQAGR